MKKVFHFKLSNRADYIKYNFSYFIVLIFRSADLTFFIFITKQQFGLNYTFFKPKMQYICIIRKYKTPTHMHILTKPF